MTVAPAVLYRAVAPLLDLPRLGVQHWRQLHWQERAATRARRRQARDTRARGGQARDKPGTQVSKAPTSSQPK